MLARPEPLFLFGSDIASILGYNKYKSSFQVWMEKTGKSESNNNDINLKFDKIIKNIVLNCWKEETNLETRISDYIDSNQYEFICSPPHSIYLDKNGRVVSGALELGSSKKYLDSSDIKFMFYYSKLQLHLGLSNLEFGEIVVLNIIEKQLYRHNCNFDPDFYSYMLEEANKFWDLYIKKDIPPPPQNIMDVKTFYTKHISGDFLDATYEQSQDIERLKIIQEQIKHLESQEKDIKGKIMIDLKDKEGLTFEDKVLCTWKNSKESTKFDVDTFKDKHPDLHSQFQKIVPGSRRFLIK